jgi:hypothetical protein
MCMSLGFCQNDHVLQLGYDNTGKKKGRKNDKKQFLQELVFANNLLCEKVF